MGDEELLRFTAVLGLAICLVGCTKESSYKLTSYTRGSSNRPSTITLRHGNQTIKAECKSFCDEYGTMVGQALSCFVEPPPSDRTHPYETNRPIFNAIGGAFVCYPGKGKVFMVRHFYCDHQPSFDNGVRLEAEFAEDSLFMPVNDLDKLYCKPGEFFHDSGGNTVTEDGKVLPIEDHVEWLEIVEVK